MLNDALLVAWRRRTERARARKWHSGLHAEHRGCFFIAIHDAFISGCSPTGFFPGDVPQTDPVFGTLRWQIQRRRVRDETAELLGEPVLIRCVRLFR